MSCVCIGPLRLYAAIECWPLVKPFHITGHVWQSSNVLWVGLEHAGHRGEGEASGVYYRGETAESMLEQIEALRSTIESGLSREALHQLLPPGGARNALDCAFWDLEAKLTGRPAWRIAELAQPRPLLTTFTCGADTPQNMASAALAYCGARAIKLKLTGETEDAERVWAVRAALPDVWLGVDANQGFTRASLEQLMPALLAARVQLIEQPFPLEQDAWLDGLRSPIPIAADESAQVIADIPKLAGRFQVVNIKLDKCGGLTEGLQMATAARQLGLETMVGNMTGTSLAMAPAFLVGQLCSVVDLDGPVFLKTDRGNPVRYIDGFIHCPG
jgi:L-Ala-D/L-Glu epimerase / N-acetyl-D-glutamate racemase